MAKVDITVFDGLKLLYEPKSADPRSLLLVSVGRDGEPNVMTFRSWYLLLDDCADWHFVFHIAIGHYTHNLLKESGQFTVNVPAQGMNDVTNYCGSVSGNNTNKFRDCNLTLAPSQKVVPPIILECAAHLECEVHGMRPFQKEDFSIGTRLSQSTTIFDAQVLCIYAEEDIVAGARELS